MKNYKLSIECASKDTIDAINRYVFNHFEGVTTVESEKDTTSHIGERTYTVLRTVRKAK